MMDVSLDTDITIHLYNAGKEELLFKYFDTLYMHEFILEHEIKNKSSSVYQRIKEEQAMKKIIIVTQKYLINIGMKKSFDDQLYDIKTLFDFGEANAIALASTLGISALVTDDTKDYGPHETLLKELIEGVIPFAFYELLYLEYLQSNDDFDDFLNNYNIINKIAYPDYPMDFLSRTKRVVRRFGKYGTSRDIQWINHFCKERNINYKMKMQTLLPHLRELDNNKNEQTKNT